MKQDVNGHATTSCAPLDQVMRSSWSDIEGVIDLMMYYYNGGWGGMLLAMLLNAAIWVLLIGLLVWGVSRFLNPRAWSSGSSAQSHEPSALEILRQRYARGEIDETTYERMRQQLSATDARTDTRAAQDALTAPPRR
jgi:putative membrane protein